MRSKFLEGSTAVLLQIIGQKVVVFINQLVIAHYLSQEDFGTFALVMSITNLTFFFGLFGLSDIAVNRSKSLYLWYDNLKNMYVLLGLFSFGLTVITAGIIFSINDDIVLLKLLLLYSIGTVFFSLNIFYEVIIRIDKKFKELSLIRFLEVLLTQVLLFLFVRGGMETYSFVVALSIVPIIKFLFYLKYYESGIIRFSLKIRWLKLLLRRSSFATGYSIISRFSYQIDYLIVALLLSRGELGMYFMSYTLAVQSFALLVANLPTVSFPMFASLANDPIRLRVKFVEITLLLALIGSAVVAIQWLVLPHAIEILLPSKWQNTVEVVQALTLAMFFRITSSQWPIMLKIQSKYKELFWTSLFYTLVMAGLLTVGVKIAGLSGMVVSLLLYYIILTGHQSYLIGIPKYFSVRTLYVVVTILLILLFCYVGDYLNKWESWKVSLVGVLMISIIIFIVGRKFLRKVNL